MENLQIEFDQLIENLPSEQNRQFEKAITSFIINHKDEQIETLKKFLTDVLEENDHYFYKYIAFISLCTLYRRQEEILNLNIIYDRYGNQFNHEALYFHLHSLKYKAEADLRNSIRDSFKAIQNEELLSHSGVLHNHAESVITLMTNKEETLFDNMEEKVEEAYKCLEKAIQLEDDYAKFYATKAQFLVYYQRFKEAKQAIRHAISLEEKGNDYQLRIAKYYQLLSIIQVKEEHTKTQSNQETFNKQMDKKIGEANNKLDIKLEKQEKLYEGNLKETKEMLEKMKQQNLQMLGFFTAIISFTVGSFQIVRSQSFINAALLLLILAGTLLIAYAGFSFIIFTASRATNWKNLTVLMIGVILIAFSMIAYQQQWIGEEPNIEYNEDIQTGV